MKYIASAVDVSVTFGGLTPHFMNFELGWYNLSELQWDKAVSLFENILIGGFDFSLIDSSSFLKKVGAGTSSEKNQKKVLLLADFECAFKEFEMKFKMCEFTGKVKILHMCCIAFIVGVCHASSNQGGRKKRIQLKHISSDDALSQRM